MIATLSSEEVLSIHEHLEEAFRHSRDPISPPGVKSMELLESAVSRQEVGFGGELKYGSSHLNAASLCYGVCSNHPFYNGNKRAALVAMLCHLDRNGTTFKADVSQDDLYKFMVRVASHYFAPKKSKRDRSDVEVEEMGKWIRARIRRIKDSDRIITYRELRSALKGRGFEMTNFKNNYADVVGEISGKTTTGLFGKKKTSTQTVRVKIAYPSDGRVVPKHVIKKVRATCMLTREHGVDAETFYGSEQSLDQFVTRFRETLTRLAKT